VPFDVVLNRGEAYFNRSVSLLGPSGSLTGTIIRSNLPVGVTNGSKCTGIPMPTTSSWCNTVSEVAQPVQTWGNAVLVANLPLRPGGSIYRIIASRQNTRVLLDGAALVTLDRGEYFETAALTGNHSISANLPIYVCQFMTSPDFDGPTAGGAEMGNMIPIEQYQTNYTFATVTYVEQNFLTVFARDTDVATMTLDGIPIGAGSFTPIVGTGFSVAVLPLSEGVHTTASRDPHGITVEGYDKFFSYLYPGGASFAPINTPDPVRIRADRSGSAAGTTPIR
jgi:hypothetical protein